jgi:hypothetical protein
MSASRSTKTRAISRFAGCLAAAALLAAASPALALTHNLGATEAGPLETPPNTSTAIGTCIATVDDVTNSVTFSGTFSGLAVPATAAHIHGLAGPGVSAPVLIGATSVTNATSGTFSGSGTLTAAQVTGMLAGQTYCNVHDATFPSGEIRGQLLVSTPALTPWATILLALCLGAASVWAIRGRMRRPSRAMGA